MAGYPIRPDTVYPAGYPIIYLVFFKEGKKKNYTKQMNLPVVTGT
jgi:hypothetical protein